MRTELPHAAIRPDPYQARTTIDGIGPLADSIEQHGLLENLVVRPEGEGYLIVAGERRWTAIGKLIKEGRWEESAPIAVLVINGESTWPQLVENIQRKDIPSWELGTYFKALIDGGHTQKQIAARIGKSHGFVSRYYIIGEGLHPKSVKFIVEHKMHPPSSDLVRIAALVKRDGKPDLDAQLKALKNLGKVIGKRRRRPRRKDKTFGEKLLHRFTKLQTDVPVPPHAVPYVEAIVRYLSGEDRTLRFKL